MKRKKMVKYQIENRGVKDKRVLEALLKVERHKFVSENLINSAYDDNPLPIGNDQTISQPYIVALMTELLELKGSEKVLEVGTGSGYQAVVLAELCKEVHSIEIISNLASKSKKLIKDLGYKNVIVYHGDGYEGLNDEAPFDGIIVTCAPPYIPDPLLEQLAENGRMVIPVGDYYQELILIRKRDGKIVKESKIPVRFVPMTGKALKKGK